MDRGNFAERACGPRNRGLMPRSAASPYAQAVAALRSSVDGLARILPSLGPRDAVQVGSSLDEVAVSMARLRGKMPKGPEALAKIVGEILELLPSLTMDASGQAARKLRLGLAQVGSAAALVLDALDPIRAPGAVFDPSTPAATGRLVALALLAQPRQPLAEVGRMYGSGCYAIYYSGDHPFYAAISGTETPIYVGKADPQTSDAKDPRDQGPRLTGRLRDHRKMIVTVEGWAMEHPGPENHPLHVVDFEYRRLVTASNAQLAAERYLIDFFQPIWNNEMKICWGISKHGDAAATRSNKRAPWDVLHPGRPWAMDERLENSKDAVEILRDIHVHFDRNPPRIDLHEIIDGVLREFAQDAVERGAPDIGDDEDEAQEEEV